MQTENWKTVLEAYKGLTATDSKKGADCTFRYGTIEKSWEDITIDGKIDFSKRDLTEDQFYNLVLAYESTYQKISKTGKRVYTMITPPNVWVENLFKISEMIQTREKDRQRTD